MFEMVWNENNPLCDGWPNSLFTVRALIDWYIEENGKKCLYVSHAISVDLLVDRNSIVRDGVK